MIDTNAGGRYIYQTMLMNFDGLHVVDWVTQYLIINGQATWHDGLFTRTPVDDRDALGVALRNKLLVFLAVHARDTDGFDALKELVAGIDADEIGGIRDLINKLSGSSNKLKPKGGLF